MSGASSSLTASTIAQEAAKPDFWNLLGAWDIAATWVSFVVVGLLVAGRSWWALRKKKKEQTVMMVSAENGVMISGPVLELISETYVGMIQTMSQEMATLKEEVESLLELRAENALMHEELENLNAENLTLKKKIVNLTRKVLSLEQKNLPSSKRAKKSK